MLHYQFASTGWFLLSSLALAVPLVQFNSLPTSLDRPLASPFGSKCSVTSGFGPRTHPVTGQSSKQHNGIDIVPPAGFKQDAELRPPAPGIIEEINNSNPGDACGLWVKIRVTKTQSIQMCHMANESTIKTLKVGDPVMSTTKLGAMGATGRVTGPHVHMIISENGVPVDPTSRVTQACASGGDSSSPASSATKGVSQ